MTSFINFLLKRKKRNAKKKENSFKKVIFRICRNLSTENKIEANYLQLQDSYHSTSSSEAGKDSIDPEINEKGKQA